MLHDFLLKPSVLIPLDQQQHLEGIAARKGSSTPPLPSEEKCHSL